MNKKGFMYIVIPLTLTVIAFFISARFIFRIPAADGGYESITYFVALLFALFVLGISAIVSAILYVGRKNRN